VDREHVGRQTGLSAFRPITLHPKPYSIALVVDLRKQSEVRRQAGLPACACNVSRGGAKETPREGGEGTRGFRASVLSERLELVSYLTGVQGGCLSKRVGGALVAHQEGVVLPLALLLSHQCVRA